MRVKDVYDARNKLVSLEPNVAGLQTQATKIWWHMSLYFLRPGSQFAKNVWQSPLNIFDGYRDYVTKRMSGGRCCSCLGEHKVQNRRCWTSVECEGHTRCPMSCRICSRFPYLHICWPSLNPDSWSPTTWCCGTNASMINPCPGTKGTCGDDSSEAWLPFSKESLLTTTYLLLYDLSMMLNSKYFSVARIQHLTSGSKFNRP